MIMFFLDTDDDIVYDDDSCTAFYLVTAAPIATTVPRSLRAFSTVHVVVAVFSNL